VPRSEQSTTKDLTLKATGRKKKRGRRIFREFACICGSFFWADISKVRSGHTRSCGCLRRRVASEANTKHGMRMTPEYRAWGNMKTRCYNANYYLFDDYGGRGITVCDEWRNDFSRFFRDVGKKPHADWELDRIDNDGNYEPGNVKWSTKIDSARNKRSVRTITIFDYCFKIPEWSEISGVDRCLIWRRLDWGWPSVDAVFQSNDQATITPERRPLITKGTVIAAIDKYERARRKCA
jgi:hypothetical protein